MDRTIEKVQDAFERLLIAHFSFGPVGDEPGPDDLEKLAILEIELEEYMHQVDKIRILWTAHARGRSGEATSHAPFEGHRGYAAHSGAPLF